MSNVLRGSAALSRRTFVTASMRASGAMLLGPACLRAWDDEPDSREPNRIRGMVLRLVRLQVEPRRMLSHARRSNSRLRSF